MDIGPVYDCYRIFPYFMELMFSLFIATIIFFLWMEIFKILFFFYANLFVYSSSIVFLVYDMARPILVSALYSTT